MGDSGGASWGGIRRRREPSSRADSTVFKGTPSRSRRRASAWSARPARMFIEEGFANRASAIVRPRPPMGNLITPAQRLAIAFLKRGERAGCPVRITYESNRPFHAPLLIPGPHLARSRNEVIMAGQLQQA